MNGIQVPKIKNNFTTQNFQQTDVKERSVKFQGVKMRNSIHAELKILSLNQSLNYVIEFSQT